jgi:NADH-quinone oxidoreductase subunit E
MKNIEEILSAYEGRSDLIDILEDIQDNYGYLSEENMRAIEQKLSIPLVEIFGVATFYAAFKFRPPGKHIIKICKGTACHVKKAETIQSCIEEMLNVRPGETTEDRMFTLECVRCIGACAKAPNIMIDDTVFGDLTKEKVEKILKEFR